MPDTYAESSIAADRPRGSDSRPPRPRWQRIAAVAALVAIAVLVAAAGYGYYRYARIASKLEPTTPGDREAVEAAVDPVVRQPRNEAAKPLYILILGADARPGETRSRSDTIILARLDVEEQSMMMLSIPRDSRVPIEGYGLDKINHAHAFGGPALTIRTVKEFTGLPVNHYVTVDFEGFAALVDAVGGVTVMVDHPTRTIPEGLQTLNAEQALEFVRTRSYPDGDFTRIKNQQKFLVAFLRQALRPDNYTRLPSIAESVAEHVETDMSIPEFLKLARTLAAIGNTIPGYTMPGTTAMIDGVSYVIPDDEAAPELFRQFAAGEVDPPAPAE
ncbi:MAG TPA: hypothetical protein DCR87_00820 [Acidobacteria bacterium]|nr:hypothetical protein [Acidobacteriota bacterium]